jgi:hypothetical protein
LRGLEYSLEKQEREKQSSKGNSLVRLGKLVATVKAMKLEKTPILCDLQGANSKVSLKALW